MTVPRHAVHAVYAVHAAAVSAAALACGQVAAQDFDSQRHRFRVVTVARGLEHPWGLAFLPDGRMLVTERPGRLRMVEANGRLSAPLVGVPAVVAEGQGGLLDVALAPDFAQSRTIYLSYSEPGQGGTAGTAAARGRLSERGLETVEVIFRQEPKVSGRAHFGSRFVFTPDGYLFITTGERNRRDDSQDLSRHMGKVIRLRPDGSVPSDNPFVRRSGARPEIWSYGHRNIQGAGAASGDPRAVDRGARSPGWRRAEHAETREELRVAGDHLRA